MAVVQTTHLGQWESACEINLVARNGASLTELTTLTISGFRSCYSQCAMSGGTLAGTALSVLGDVTFRASYACIPRPLYDNA